MMRVHLENFVPGWLGNKLPLSPSWAWRWLWSHGLLADASIDWTVQGSMAFLPDRATPTALGPIGRSRGILRGRAESGEDYAVRLAAWWELHRGRGSMRGITQAVQHFLGERPDGGQYTVRCVSRSGTWGIRERNGEYTFMDRSNWGGDGRFDWDSHCDIPKGWSDLWIIVSPMPWALLDDWGTSTTSFGHEAPQEHVQRLRRILDEWRAARTRIVAVIWTPEEDPRPWPHTTLGPPLDPTNPQAVKPDGNWGRWGRPDGNGGFVASRPSFMRFWQ